MAEGTAFGGQCYATQLEAANMWCSSVVGVTSSGALSCVSPGTNPAPSSLVGGQIGVRPRMRFQPAAGGATQEYDGSTILRACETYGLDYWAPAQALWIAAVILIATSRSVIKRFFVHNAA